MAELGGSEDQDELRRLRTEKAAGEFWRGVFAEITDKTEREKIEAELTDYYFILKQVPEVYMHITGGLLSKPNYYASGVKAAADDHIDKVVEDEIAARFPT